MSSETETDSETPSDLHVDQIKAIIHTSPESLDKCIRKSAVAAPKLSGKRLFTEINADDITVVESTSIIVDNTKWTSTSVNRTITAEKRPFSLIDSLDQSYDSGGQTKIPKIPDATSTSTETDLAENDDIEDIKEPQTAVNDSPCTDEGDNGEKIDHDTGDIDEDESTDEIPATPIESKKKRFQVKSSRQSSIGDYFNRKSSHQNQS